MSQENLHVTQKGKEEWILFTKFWICNRHGRSQFIYIPFQSKLTPTKTIVFHELTGIIPLKGIRNNVCQSLYVLLFKKDKKKVRSNFYGKKCIAYQCIIQNLLIFEKSSYQFLFVYFCYHFFTGKLGNAKTIFSPIFLNIH